MSIYSLRVTPDYTGLIGRPIHLLPSITTADGSVRILVSRPLVSAEPAFLMLTDKPGVNPDRQHLPMSKAIRHSELQRVDAECWVSSSPLSPTKVGDKSGPGL